MRSGRDATGWVRACLLFGHPGTRFVAQSARESRRTKWGFGCFGWFRRFLQWRRSLVRRPAAPATTETRGRAPAAVAPRAGPGRRREDRAARRVRAPAATPRARAPAGEAAPGPTRHRAREPPPDPARARLPDPAL